MCAAQWRQPLRQWQSGTETFTVKYDSCQRLLLMDHSRLACERALHSFINQTPAKWGKWPLLFMWADQWPLGVQERFPVDL